MREGQYYERPVHTRNQNHYFKRKSVDFKLRGPVTIDRPANNQDNAQACATDITDRNVWHLPEPRRPQTLQGVPETPLP